MYIRLNCSEMTRGMAMSGNARGSHSTLPAQRSNLRCPIFTINRGAGRLAKAGASKERSWDQLEPRSNKPYSPTKPTIRSRLVHSSSARVGIIFVEVTYSDLKGGGFERL